MRSEDSKFFRAPIYWAHRAVFFAIAQLSCIVCNGVVLAPNSATVAVFGDCRPFSASPKSATIVSNVDRLLVVYPPADSVAIITRLRFRGPLVRHSYSTLHCVKKVGLRYQHEQNRTKTDLSLHPATCTSIRYGTRS